MFKKKISRWVNNFDLIKHLAPNGEKLPFENSGSYIDGFQIIYTPNCVGKHHLNIFYGGAEIRGSPFTARCSDPSKIFVSEVNDGFVGKKSHLIVDANGAGEGNLQIAIGVVSGKNIQNHVQQIGSGKFEVTFTPLEGALHEASVTFNSFHVQGSPFKFNVLDVSRISVSGDGIGLVKCREETYFRLNMPAPGFLRKMLDVMIMGKWNFFFALFSLIKFLYFLSFINIKFSKNIKKAIPFQMMIFSINQLIILMICLIQWLILLD